MAIHWGPYVSASLGAILLIPQLLAAQPAKDTGGGQEAARLVAETTYRLRPADTIEIDFRFTPEFNQTLLVRPDGYVTLRGVGDVLAAGITVEQFTRVAETKYSGLLRDPVISVAVKDFERPFFLVLGQVEKPGKYDLRGRTTILEALTIAGGIKHTGKQTNVVLFRSTDTEAPAIVVDVKKLLETPQDPGPTFWIGQGDLVYVPRTVLSKVERFLPLITAAGWLLWPWR